MNTTSPEGSLKGHIARDGSRGWARVEQLGASPFAS